MLCRFRPPGTTRWQRTRTLMKTGRPEHFFIVGAAKCGTTTLHRWLEQHPDICMSRPKEPPFFERDYAKGLDFYRESCFAHYGGERFAGEARHRNMFLRYVPKRMAESYPEAALIAVVRNPVSRAFSHFLHRRRHGQEQATFEEAIEADFVRIEREKSLSDEQLEARHVQDLDPRGAGVRHRTYIDTGYYADQLERILALFPRERVKVFLTEDLQVDPERVFRETLQVISPHLDPMPVTLSRENANPGRLLGSVHRLLLQRRGLRRLARQLVSKPLRGSLKEAVRMVEKALPFSLEEEMTPETRRRLVEHYREHNCRLAELLGRDLSHWDAGAGESPRRAGGQDVGTGAAPQAGSSLG